MSATAAIQVIASRALEGRLEARARWAAALPNAGPLIDWVDRLQTAGRVTVNFHPDRVTRHGDSVAAGLLRSGAYETQWISGVSAGSRSAILGGERQRFERVFFEGAYEGLAPTSGKHPVYGALDLLVDPHGGAPRFGSSFLVLEPHVRDRVTLSLGDSHLGPGDVGTFAEPARVIAGLAEQAERRRLLNRDLGRDGLLAVLDGSFVPGPPARDLDGYVEVQVHGGISLADDVAAVVLDPSFQGTAVETDLTVASQRDGFEIRWHTGSELDAADVPEDFRGPAMPELARQVARPDGIVDAAAIGVAAAEENFEEPSADGDPAQSPTQQLKRLWHTVLAFGHDAVM